jgi:hypothetical protein
MTRSGSISEIAGAFFPAELAMNLVTCDAFLLRVVVMPVSPSEIGGKSRASIELGVLESLRSGLLK